ncbi:MAG: O-antigen ligase family protein [Candidatus Yanofskybacteria bacterium]|nr:O-antigen ligase family protein [Candidatus Yanofskybacteria bacterium]
MTHDGIQGSVQALGLIDRVLIRVIRSGLFLTAFIPLVIFQRTFSPFFFGKEILFRLLIELLAPLYLFVVLRHPVMRPPRSLPLLLLWVSVAVAIIAGLASANPQLSFFGTWERMGGVFTLLHGALLVTMLSGMFQSRGDWRTLFGLSVGVALVSALYGMLQLTTIPGIAGATSRFRIFGTIGNPAAFAGYLLVNVFLGLALLPSSSLRARTAIGVSTLVLGGGILLSAVRGAVAGLIAGLCFLGYLKWGGVSALFRGRRMVMLVVGALLLGGVLFFFSNTDHWTRLVRFDLFWETIGQRLVVWWMGIRGAAQHPMLGWGPEQFPSLYSVWFDARLFTNAQGVIFDRAHNIIVDIASTQGLIGLTVYAALLWATFIRLPGVLKAGFVAVLGHLLFFFDLLPTALLVGYLIAYAAHRGDSARWRMPTGKRVQGVSTVVVVALSVGGLLLNIGSLTSNLAVARSYTAFATGNGVDGIRFGEVAMGRERMFLQDVRRKYTEGLVGYAFRASPEEREAIGGSLKNLLGALREEIDHTPDDYAGYLYLYKACRANRMLFSDAYGDSACSPDVLTEGIRRLPRALPLQDEQYNGLMEAGKFSDAIIVVSGIRAALEQPSSETLFMLGAARVSMAVARVPHDPSALQEGMWEIQSAIDGGYRDAGAVQAAAQLLERSREFSSELALFSALARFEPRYLVPLAYTHLIIGEKDAAHQIADQALALPDGVLSPAGFQVLAELYRLLGDTAGRSRAFLRSTP